jgi:hypothetical protein
LAGFLNQIFHEDSFFVNVFLLTFFQKKVSPRRIGDERESKFI